MGSYNEIGCGTCGIPRPRWHGGKHNCLKLGERYYLAHQPSRLITPEELEFLGIPGPVA